jgi:hypothetical protein
MPIYGRKNVRIIAVFENKVKSYVAIPPLHVELRGGNSAWPRFYSTPLFTTALLAH